MSLINFIDDYIDYYGLTREDPTYHYNGVPIPRTTDIISSMLHEQGLMEWSNRLGKYQKKDYNEYMNTASTIGTCVHSFIEEYLQDESEHTPHELPFTISDKVFNAYHSFKKWWIELNKAHKVKIIFIEKELTCEFFGGRLDLLLEIDGLTYLVDFKSSNHASYKYFLQLSSYKYMLNMKEDIRVDGCIVLMLNKKYASYQSLTLDFRDSTHRWFIDQCESTFLLLAQSYLQRLCVEQSYYNLFGNI